MACAPDFAVVVHIDGLRAVGAHPQKRQLKDEATRASNPAILKVGGLGVGDVGSGGALPPFPTTPKHALSSSVVRLISLAEFLRRRNWPKGKHHDARKGECLADVLNCLQYTLLDKYSISERYGVG